MTRWAAFAGLTALLTSSLLALARLSQDVVSDGPAVTDALDHRRDGRHPDARDHPRGPVVPRFEEPASRDATDGTVTGDAAPVPDLSTGELLLNVALTQGLFGVVLAGGAVYFGVPRDALGFAGSPLATGLPGVAVGVALGLVLWLANEAVGVLVEAAGLGYDESLRSLLAPDSAVGWVVLLAVILPTVAVVEEFVFRAAAVGAIAAGFPAASPWALAVVSSVAFGLAHGAQGRTGVLVTAGLGFALAAGFVLTGSFLVVAVAHYLVNALELVVHEGLGYERPGVVAGE